MNNLLIRNILRFLFLLLLQVVVLNNVYLGGYITPFLYVLFILMLPTDLSKVALILIAFGSGLMVDIFDNMPGFHTFSCTLVAFCRIVFADKILTRGEQTTILTPSIRTVVAQQYVIFLTLNLFIYSFAYFLLEMFSLRDFGTILISSIFSTLATGILAIVYQAIFIPQKQ